MTATDELRRLLDGRGVEYTDAEDAHTQYTWWSDGDHEIAACNSGERLAVYDLTPAQAVEATLGRGTCEVVSKLLIEGEYVPAEYYEFEMECGEGFKWDESEPPRYCPNCGRKVVDA